MNYFEFYGIPESFNIEPGTLKKKFYELSKLYHPDFYAGEDEAKQQEILELSTLNNKAYQVLSDPARRMEVDNVEQLAEVTTEVLAIEGDINERLAALTADYEQLDHTAQESRRNE